MINNKMDVSKCVACVTAKPAEKPVMPVTAFKTDSSKWECPTCMISNQSDVHKCVACQTSKPTNSIAPLTNSFKLQTNSGKWECSTCLVQNESSVNQCVACTARPGKAAPVGLKTSTGSSATWECPTCMIQSKKDVLKCPACQTSQPGAKVGPMGHCSDSCTSSVLN